MDINSIYNYILTNKYLLAFSIFVVFFLGALIAVKIIQKFFLKLAAKTETLLDDHIFEAINKYIAQVLISTGLYIGLQKLALTTNIEIVVERILLSIIIIYLVLMVGKILFTLIEHWGQTWAKKTKSTVDDQIVRFLDKFSRAVVWIIGFLLILQAWGVQVGPLLASLGIAGLAIAFALQQSLSNIFGGISLILDKSIKVGDVIEIEGGTSGTVMDVGIRSTRIRTWDNEVLIIPNGSLSNSKITNYVQPKDEVRVVVPFSVAYGTDPEKVRKLVLKEIKKIESFIPEPAPFVPFMEMGDSSLNFRAYFYVDSYSKRFSAKNKATELIYNALNKAKIEIPFPQMDVHMKK